MLMSNPWPAVVFRTVAGGAFLTVFGLATGVPWLVLLAGTALLIHELVQVYRLERWLRASRRRHPPRGRGLWGHVLDGLDRQQNRQRAPASAGKPAAPVSGGRQCHARRDHRAVRGG